MESTAELHRQATATQQKKAVFQPKQKPIKDDFLAKLRLHRKWIGL